MLQIILFFRIEDVRLRKSLYHDFTNESLIERHFEVDRFSPTEAGRILARLSEDYDFLLYEYFLTDRAGHAQQMKKAVEEVRKLQTFLEGLLDELDLDDTLVILTSDHGNIEDLSKRSHTRNRVPTLLWGAGAETISHRIRSIVDIAPAVLHMLENADNGMSQR